MSVSAYVRKVTGTVSSQGLQEVINVCYLWDCSLY